MGPGLDWSSLGDVLLPEVIAERCVHSRMEQATCQACVDACPRGAWVIDEDQLGIDTERCDGCGLCSPACPEGAVAPAHGAVRYRSEKGAIAFAACPRAGTGPGDGLLPCLHILGIQALARLYRKGVRRLRLCRGDCKDCPRGESGSVDMALEQLGVMLTGRGLDPLEVSDLRHRDWLRARDVSKTLHQQPSIGRRAFFGGLLNAAVESATEFAEREDPSGAADFEPPGRILPEGQGGRLALYAPRIDPASCTGCDACARLCPHEVIRIEPDAYRMQPQDCTGCGICVDLCIDRAVIIQALEPNPQTSLPLIQRRCAACGVEFRLPRAAGQGRDLCPICLRTGQHDLLYQVLD